MTAILVDSLVPIFAVMGLGYFAGWARQSTISMSPR
jgi:hypothetical protein